MPTTAPKAANREELEDRRQRAFAMRRAGANYRMIGKALGVSHTQAEKDVRTVLQRVQAELLVDAAEHIATEVDRLDMALRAIAPQVQQGHLGAVDRFIRISESRRKLLGLDAADGADRDLNERITRTLEALAEVRQAGAPEGGGGGVSAESGADDSVPPAEA